MFVKFFRNRAINAFLKRKKTCILPDISTYPAVAILINEGQMTKIKDISTVLDRLFTLKKFEFFVLANEQLENVKADKNVHFVTKKDFGFFGLLKSETQRSLSAMTFDMTMNLSNEKNEMLTEEYIMTVIDAKFRVSFGKSYELLYDLVIDSKSEDLTVKIEVLHKYLKMLLGK